MTKRSEGFSLRDQMFEDIAAELQSLRGEALEEFLRELGHDPDNLIEMHEKALKAAQASQGKARLAAARAELDARPSSSSATILSLDIARKKVLAAAIEKRMRETGDMTLAARNRQSRPEADLDGFLEACLLLGVIDEKGDLKD